MKDKVIYSWMFKTDPVNNFAWWDNFLTKEECKNIIKDNKTKLKQATVSTKGIINKKIRDSHMYFISPENQYQWLFRRLTDVIIKLNERYFNFDVSGLIEGLQFTHYKGKGNYYGKHLDSIYGGVIRKLSVSIQLSDPKKYKGGDLILHNGNKGDIMRKDQGTLFIFPSYTLHEVTPVTKGERNSLVCWVYGPSFK